MDVAEYDAKFQPPKLCKFKQKKPSRSKGERHLLKLWRHFKKRHWYGFYSNDELYNVFKEFVEDPRYGPHFGKKPKIGCQKRLCKFIQDTQTLPSKGWMHKWFKRQLKSVNQIIYYTLMR